MKLAFIFVQYHTPAEELRRITSELHHLGISQQDIYIEDNNGDNRGFAHGVNKGITKALADGAEIVVIANTDISLGTVKLDDIVEGIKTFDVLGFACKQHAKVWYGGVLDPKRLSGALNYHKPASRYSACDFVSGSCMAVKREVLERLGGFDESYFMYYEDVDFSLRAKKAGYTVGIDAGRIYEHFETSDSRGEKKYYLARNRLKLLVAHGNAFQKLYEVARLPKTLVQERSVLLRIIRKDPFFLNYFSLNVSSVANKLLNFLLFIVLVNTLSIHEYGIYTLVWAHVNLLTPLMDLGTTAYGLVYGGEKPERHIFTLFSLRLYVSCAVFLLTIVLAFFFGYTNQTIGYIILISFVIFSNALSGSFLILTSLFERVYLSSIFSFIFNVILIAFLIGVTYQYHSVSYIFMTVFIFYNIYTLSNLIGIKRVLTPRMHPQAREHAMFAFLRSSTAFKPREWWHILKKSYVFVLIGLFASLYFKGDVFLLNYLKGDEAVGIYSAGYKFLDALMFFAASYNVTTAPVFAKLRETNPTALYRRVKRDAVLLTTLGVTVSVVFYLTAPYVLPFFLKGRFIEAIAVSRIVIFALPLILLISIFLNLLYALRKSMTVVYIFIIQMVINLGLNAFLIPRFSYIASSYLTVFSELLNLIMLLFVTINVVHKLRLSYENIN